MSLTDSVTLTDVHVRWTNLYWNDWEGAGEDAALRAYLGSTAATSLPAVFPTQVNSSAEESSQPAEAQHPVSSDEIEDGSGWYAECARIFQEITREGDKGLHRRQSVVAGLKSILDKVVALPIEVPTTDVPRKKFMFEKRR